MGQVFTELNETYAAWIQQQHMFFVASAPLASDGHINCSPKGMDSFRVLGPRQVAYIDMSGSGAETAAHIRENKRLIIMFCAFSDKPLILRLYGHANYHLPDNSAFVALQNQLPYSVGTRGIIELNITRVSTACGFGVPLYEYQGDRDGLEKWFQRSGTEGLARYRAQHNARSIDGLSALA